MKDCSMVKIVNVRQVTKRVLIDGKDFVLVKFDFSSFPEEMGKMGYKPTMYGTIPVRMLGASRFLLADFAAGATIADALNHRMDLMQTEKMLFDAMLSGTII